MSYILTQSHPSCGFQGLVVDREAYLSVPHYDRALFDILHEDSSEYYYCRLEVTNGDKCTCYLLADSREIFGIMASFHLLKCVEFVIKEVAKGNNASLSRGDNEMFIFSPIKSN